METTLKILLIEDDHTDAGLVIHKLKPEGHDVHCINSYDKVADSDLANADLVLTDYRLGGYTGLDVLLKIQAFDPTLPVIIVSGTIQDQLAADILKAGATDFVSKDHLNLLPGAILRAQREATLLKEVESAAKTLEANEKRYRKLIGHSADVLLLLDEQSKVVSVSPAVEQAMGYKPEELTGTFGYDMPVEEDLAYSEQFFKQAMSNPGEHIYLKYRCKTKHGAPGMMEGTVTNYLHDPDIAAVVINFRNISKSHKAEEALKRSEDFHRSLLENGFDGILILDDEGKITYESPSNKAAMGYDVGDLQNTSAFDLLHPDDLTRAQEAFQRIIQAPLNREMIHYRGLHKKGHYIRLEAVGINMLHEASVGGVVVNFRDVTERIQAEQNRKRLSEIIESSSDFISISGADRHPIYINPAGLRMLEAPEDFDYSNHTIEAFHPEEIFPIMQDAIIPALSEKGFWRGESVLHTLSGNKVPISQSIVVHKDEQGEVEFVSTIIRDMSVEKRRETELRDSEQKLTERVKEMRCIMEVSQLLYATEEIDQEIAEDIVHLIEPAYRYPEITKVRLRLRDQVTASRGFVESRWRQAAPIILHGDQIGEIEVFYVQEKPPESEGAFLKEERDLINSLAAHIGSRLEQISAQVEIKAQREKLQGITNAIPGVVFRSRIDKGGQTKFEFVSSGLRDIMGIEPEDLEKDAQLVLERILPEDLPRFTADMQEGYEKQASLVSEFRVKDWDNNIKWIAIRSLPEKTENGIRYANGIMTDITDQKEAQQYIIDSEISYRQLFDNSQELIYIQDLDGTFIDVNQKVLDSYGYTRGEIVGKSPDFLGVPGENDLEEVLAKVQLAVEGKPQRFTWWALRKNGETFPKDVIIQRGSYFGKDALIAFGRDISEQVAAEQKMREHARLFEQLFQNSPLAKVLVNVDFKVQMTNKAFEMLFGYSGREVAGRDLSKIIVPEFKIEESEVIRKMIGERKSVTIETVRLRKDGVLNPVVVYGIPVADGERFIGYYWMYADIAHKKQAEEELNALNAELVKYNEELEQYAYVASHNLRAPLANLIGLVNGVEPQKLDKHTGELFSRIKVSADQADTILREIVQMVSESERESYFSEEVSVEHILNNVSRECKEQLKAVQGSIEMQLDINQFLFSKGQLKSILSHLVTNAIKFHDPARPLDIRVCSHKEGEFVKLSVADNGIGIDLAKHGQRLFKMYQHLTQTGAEGRGLGLYAIKKHLELAGGTINVESEPGKGTTFHVYIPRVNKQQTA